MSRTRLVVAGVAAAALFAGVGSALAGDGNGDKGARCERLLERIAEKQGSSVGELKATRKARALGRLASALAAGRITAAQEARIRARIEAGRAGCGRLVRRAKFRRGGIVLGAAATYLGTSTSALRSELAAGKSLAQAATARGKSVDGLRAAILKAFEERLDQAKRLSAERRAKLLDRLEARLDKLLNRILKGASK